MLWIHHVRTTSWWNFSDLLSLCVFHLTWLLPLYTNTWFSVYCFHCIQGIVTFKPKVILPDDSCVLFEGNGRNTHGIVSDFVRALNEATEVNMARVSGWAWSGRSPDFPGNSAFGIAVIPGHIWTCELFAPDVAQRIVVAPGRVVSMSLILYISPISGAPATEGQPGQDGTGSPPQSAMASMGPIMVPQSPGSSEGRTYSPPLPNGIPQVDHIPLTRHEIHLPQVHAMDSTPMTGLDSRLSPVETQFVHPHRTHHLSGDSMPRSQTTSPITYVSSPGTHHDITPIPSPTMPRDQGYKLPQMGGHHFKKEILWRSLDCRNAIYKK
jgi:hypothetical protein